ncbi:MAG: hypothetical protein NZ739_02340 [Verrucomicrobiae bacterium]|nr:hypothetical protein [Verrucomicrobiae bacterium]MCX7723454.1 hypothetical protein [Verrucomicrobiae bacterium]MDW7979801.1 hypothetical protein [Verrucomicrobiales bacterium]
MKKLIGITLVGVVLTTISAQGAGFQLSLTPDIAIHPRTTTIRGVSLGIWGENPQHSFNFGFVNGSTGESSGFSWAIIANYADSYKGVQWGIVNVAKTSFVGWQDGWVNYSRGTFVGFQSALVNIAQEFKGLQLGVINYADDLRGVQIGGLNIAVNNPWFTGFPSKLATGFPIINWSF